MIEPTPASAPGANRGERPIGDCAFLTSVDARNRRRTGCKLRVARLNIRAAVFIVKEQFWTHPPATACVDKRRHVAILPASCPLMTCPICGAAMTAQTLDGHLGTTVSIDLCFPCQVFWFDTKESLRLSPGAVLTLFRAIGERAMDGPTRAPAGQPPGLSAMPGASLSDPRSAAQHAVSVPALPEGSRAADHVRRVSAREGFHPAAVGPTDRGPPPERADRQLLELRRPDRAREELGVRRIAARRCRCSI